MAIAHLKEGQEEFFLNLSVPRVGDPDDLTLVVRGLSFFLNSGSFGLRIACFVPSVVISEGFRKTSGPLSQLETARSFGFRPRARSQISRIDGTLNVPPLIGGRDLAYSLDTISYIDVKSSAFITVAKNNL